MGLINLHNPIYKKILDIHLLYEYGVTNTDLSKEKFYSLLKPDKMGYLPNSQISLNEEKNLFKQRLPSYIWEFEFWNTYENYIEGSTHYLMLIARNAYPEDLFLINFDRFIQMDTFGPSVSDSPFIINLTKYREDPLRAEKVTVKNEEASVYTVHCLTLNNYINNTIRETILTAYFGESYNKINNITGKIVGRINTHINLI